jgi:hypothetical protein
MTAPHSELEHEIGIAAWAYELAPGDSTPDQLCELIVTALAQAGCLCGHDGLRMSTLEAAS